VKERDTEATLDLLDLAPSDSIGNVHAHTSSGERARLLDRLQQVDTPIAEHQLTVLLDPELGANG
jgi:hypothetical protein